MKIQKLIAVFALALAPAFASAVPNLVTNGSFEAPNIPNNSWTIFYGSIPGWSTGPAGVEVRDNNAGTAYDGSQFVELDTTSNSWIQQTLNTVIGESYLISFAYSPRIGVNGTSNKIDIWWNGVKLGSANGSGLNQANHTWLIYEFDVVAASSASVLRFAAAGTSDSLGGSLDAISVSLVSEPAMPALILAGLGLVGFAARRRKA